MSLHWHPFPGPMPCMDVMPCQGTSPTLWPFQLICCCRGRELLRTAMWTAVAWLMSLIHTSKGDSMCTVRERCEWGHSLHTLYIIIRQVYMIQSTCAFEANVTFSSNCLWISKTTRTHTRIMCGFEYIPSGKISKPLTSPWPLFQWHSPLRTVSNWWGMVNFWNPTYTVILLFKYTPSRPTLLAPHWTRGLGAK